ncbi:hypothetical protein N781_04370 [Pontibacillus halophilus JSM 076056 = DSM 19796]|uniref:DUF4944 domain-containing protein n=1 Tax=Pontibacillus halophilus JSM 076056 = DSM 19796 TaxID=1385510 RepID=A0A0A5GJR3_9BACI|nr:DUF4944 domain-containing protein [Pontibacillus halophilus]KGX91400.1 hypothetical protein N781_04370 [Pontibacillus halophilus JSM 076056 = DSM 19796]
MKRTTSISLIGVIILGLIIYASLFKTPTWEGISQSGEWKVAITEDEQSKGTYFGQLYYNGDVERDRLELIRLDYKVDGQSVEGKYLKEQIDVVVQDTLQFAEFDERPQSDSTVQLSLDWKDGQELKQETILLKEQ